IDKYNLVNNPAYTWQSVQSALSSGNEGDLVAYDFDEFKTEKISTWEVGYKGQLFGKLFVDSYYYYSSYSDFIAEVLLVQSNSNNASDLVGGGLSQEYGFDINATGNVTSHG
ncbi:MAG: hypothetical protein NWS46_09550, partial [Cyclobacteriaceae bacterium]|nr:hypothetical protein [Cyclobacteriaceae bacterium]